MINLETLQDCRLCGANCKPIVPSSDLEKAKIVVVYDIVTKQDVRFGDYFQSNGGYFAKKELLKHFKEDDLYFTAATKCEKGNEKICKGTWLDKEIEGKYLLLMGQKAYSAVYSNGKDFPKNVGKSTTEAAVWYSPLLFETRGIAFFEDFNNFCEGIKNVIG